MQVERDLALLATLARRFDRRQPGLIAFRPSEAVAELLLARALVTLEATAMIMPGTLGRPRPPHWRLWILRLFRTRYRRAALSRQVRCGRSAAGIMQVIGRLEIGVTKEYLANIKQRPVL